MILMKDFYQVQIDHGDEWSESTDVLAVSPQRAAYEHLKGLAEEDWEWSVEWHNFRVRKGGSEWEHFRLRAKMKVAVEDYAERPLPSATLELAGNTSPSLDAFISAGLGDAVVMDAGQQTLDLAMDASPAFHAVPCSSLRERYLDAIKGGYWPWAERHPRSRFSEYDHFRPIWIDELRRWLFGENPHQVYSLTAFAWAVQHARMSEGGYKSVCLNWSDRNQRVYLGDGLLEYLGLLKEEVERVYGQNNTRGKTEGFIDPDPDGSMHRIGDALDKMLAAEDEGEIHKTNKSTT